jgi:uncharacterized membrane protein
MNLRVYGLVATALLAVVVHLSFVLFAPEAVMAEKIGAAQGLGGEEKLAVLGREDAVKLFGGESQWLVTAICAFDMARGPLLVTAAIPVGYWSMSVFSMNGDNFYTLNDRQADVATLSVMIKPSEAESQDTDNRDIAVPEGDVLGVVAPEARGLVMLRALAAEPAEYARVSEVLARSSCRPVRSDR